MTGPRPVGRRLAAFLNIPFDTGSEKLLLAYIAGLCAHGLVPRAALEIVSAGRLYDRIPRILGLIQQCAVSLHDLSKVQIDETPPRTPRFNMPFELGLAVAAAELARDQEHSWFVFEAKRGRLAKSLSDLRGVDEFVHGGRVSGVFTCLINAFGRGARYPSMAEVQGVYEDLTQRVPTIRTQSGAASLFEPRAFADLVTAAQISARDRLPWLTSSEA